MNAITATPHTVATTSENPQKPQQRQTAKDIIAANVKRLIEQLEAGHSDALTAYLNAMSRFHRYSLLNCLEIARQRPTASRVAGMLIDVLLDQAAWSRKLAWMATSRSATSMRRRSVCMTASKSARVPTRCGLVLRTATIWFSWMPERSSAATRST